MLQRRSTTLACRPGKSAFVKTSMQIIKGFFYPLLFLIALVLLQSNMALFIFDREAVAQGEWWRLLTAHFTHSSASHALWDVLAFAAVTLWLSQYSVKQMIAAVLLGIAAVDVLLLSAFSPLDYYCGLSGILFSPLLLVCYHYRQANRGLLGFLPFVIVCAKLVWEVLVQTTLLVDTLWQAYPEAHLAGFMGGLACLVWQVFATSRLESAVKN